MKLVKIYIILKRGILFDRSEAFVWLSLQIFGFRALWSPYYFLFILSIAIAYYLITGPYRHKISGALVAKPTKKQKTYFYIAMILLYIVKGAPVDLLSHIMLTFHMAQLAIYLLVFPMFIIMGVPAWIWRKIVDTPVIKPVVHFLTKPIVSLLLFNGLFSLYHIPVVFDFSKTSIAVHATFSIVLLLAAFVVWWPLLTPLEDHNKIQPLLKLIYILVNGILITPACVLIIFASTPLFAAYTQDGAWIQAMSLCVPGNVLDGIDTITLSGAEMFSPLSTMEDQQLGGIVMKTMQEITYGLLLGKVYFSWAKRRNREIDPLPTSSEMQTKASAEMN